MRKLDIKKKLKEIISLADKIIHYVSSLEEDYFNGDVDYDETVADTLAIFYDTARDIKSIARKMLRTV